MPWKDRRVWKVSSAVFAVAVVLNFPWEMLQHRSTGWIPAARRLGFTACEQAWETGCSYFSSWSPGAGILGGLDWFRRPGAAGYAWMLVSGLVIAIAVEWTSVHILKRWSYKPAMPLLPGLEIGLLPVAQMLVLPPAIFAIAARLTPKQLRRKEES